MTVQGLNRRQVLGAVGAAAGAMAVQSGAQAAQQPANRCTVRVAAVSYAPPDHNHRKLGVNLKPLRDMTAQVAREDRAVERGSSPAATCPCWLGTKTRHFQFWTVFVRNCPWGTGWLSWEAHRGFS